jgi:hypothetical protein
MKTSAPKWIVAMLWILAALDIITGVEMFFFPSAWFFKLVPGVTETGAFNAHLVMDGGTFFLAVGIGLAAAAYDPYRNTIAIVVAAIAGVMHSILHIWSHAEGLLSDQHLPTELFGILAPAILLIAIAIIIYRTPHATQFASARAA